MTSCVGFPAVASASAKVLILGSLPGVQSLEQRKYYAHKNNSFWRIMEVLLGLPIETPYQSRLRALKKHRVALWDVCTSAIRIGSLDSNIEIDTIVVNDFDAFFKAHKNVELVCFNGQPASKLFRKLVLPNLPAPFNCKRFETLPSTSPAHARMSLKEKADYWVKIIKPVLLP